MQEVQSTLPLGMIIRGRYVVERVLGRGSCGAVYLVRDTRENQKLFALKEVINPGRKDRYRFGFDPIALRRLEHPALPRIYTLFNSNKQERAYILAEYIEGPNLEKVRLEQPAKRFSLPEVMTFIAPVMNAVMYLHNRQPPIIHQNINPSNMIVPKAGSGTVLVGLGFAQEEHKTDATIVLQNTTGYTAPEQYSGNGRISPRADIYALGATLYTLLTGTVPINAFYRLKQLFEKELDPLVPVHQTAPAIPTGVAGAIHRAMSVSSDERFFTVEQFWEALWQVVTVPSEVQQFPNSMVVPPIEEEREPDANQVMQQATEPRMKAVDKEKLALQVAQQPSAFIGLQITPPQPPFLTQKDLETPIPKSLQKQPRAHVLSTAYHKIVPCFLVLFQPERVVPLGTNLWLAVLRKKRTLLLFLIALLATLLVMGVGAGLWFYTATSYHSSSAIPTLTNHPKATPPYTTANPRSKVTATPTPIGTSFPQVTKLYSGTIHDIAGNVTTKLSFTDMQQQQGSISGYFIGLGLKGPLKGTINTSRHIQFVVMGNAEQPNLSFDGVMLSDGNIAGIYCGLNQEGKCSDYGIWSVTPVAS